VVSWTFLTGHARVLLLVAQDPGVRLRDIAASLGISERSAFGIITDLVEAGYVVKEKDGRRNRYHIQAHLPLPEPTSQERTVGEVLALLTGTGPAAACKPAAAGARIPAGTVSALRRKQVPGELPANPGAAAPRRDSPRGAVPGGRRRGRDRRMDRE
jgi:hypothetical protein